MKFKKGDPVLILHSKLVYAGTVGQVERYDPDGKYVYVLLRPQYLVTYSEENILKLNTLGVYLFRRNYSKNS